MKQSTKLSFISIATLVLLLAASLLSGPTVWNAEAANLAAPTPVSFSGQSGANTKTTIFSGNITADTRWCNDFSNYKVIDLQYVIDQGTVNTVTLTTQWSNDNVNFETNATVVAANAADGHGGNQYGLFGTYTCILADVTNANSLNIKVYGLER